MSHVRKQLRDAIVTLVTGLSTTGSRVFTGRVYPMQEAELPCLWVNTIPEDGVPQDLSVSGILQRTVTVEIVGIARGTSGLVDTMDTICEEVETALGAGVILGGTTVALDYTGTDHQLSGEADQPIGRASIRYVCNLYTTSSAPGTLVMV